MNSLLARLLLVVSIAVLPALGLQAYTEIDGRRIRQQIMEDEALRLVGLVAAAQSRIIEGAEQVLDALSSTPAVQDNMPAICRRLLANLLQISPRYNHVSVLGLDGRIICAPEPVDPAINASDRTYFRLALQTGTFVIGDYAVGRASGRPTIHMAKPFRNRDGVVAGILEVALSLDWLGQQLGRLPLPPGAYATIADRNGTILARTHDGARFVGTPIRPENRFTLEGDAARVTTVTTLDGDQRLAAYSPPGADPKGLRVSVVMDRDNTFAAVERANRIGVELIFAGLALALLLTALAGSRLIRRPASRLLAAAERWRTGDLTASTGLHDDGSEFGRLGLAFDEMAAALSARERALRTALESTTDGVLVLDRAWRFTYLNERCKALIARGRDLLGQVVWEAFPGLAGTKFGDAYREAMESGVPTSARGYYGPLDGYFEARIYPSPEGVTVFYHDLSEEHRIATELADSETRLRLAQEAGGIGVWEFDLATRAMTWSAQQYRLHGIDPASGPPTYAAWLGLLEPADRATILDAMAEIESGRMPLLRLELRIRRASDGAQRWLASVSRVLMDDDGCPARLVGVNFDTTERHQAADDLYRATALLRAVGTCSPDPIYAKDGDGRFLFANPALLAVLGRTADDVIGRTDADLHHDPAQAAEVMGNDRRIMATGCGDVVEETFDAAGLGTRVFRSAKAPLRAEDGTALGIVAVSSDITALKRAEAALRRLSDDLEARVREEVAAREAAQALVSHSERMQALGQLAGGIAHDFNNVLQTFVGAATLIERRPGDEPGVRRLARLAIEAAERGASITRRLLAFGRRGDLRAEALDVLQLLTGLREILAHTLGAGIEVEVRPGDALPRLHADKGQLETALVNLATNARDAMPQGGRLVLAAAVETVSTPHPSHPRQLAPGRYVRIIVTDTGSGMDAATLARATEPFFTTKEVGVGTGLGLSMARGFAEQSGGGLTIESNPGKGTTVTLWLPEAGPDDAFAADMTPRAVETTGLLRSGPAKARASVLLVDDEPIVREIISEHLEDAGFHVLAAADGAEALAVIGSMVAVDALVTDLSMPGMDGLAVIHAVHERRPGLPAVLLTGHDGVGATLAVSATVNAAFSMLRKPVSGTKLVDHLRALIAARPAGNERHPKLV